MKTTGELYGHKRLIAITGTFLAAITLTGCGSGKVNDPQAKRENLSVGQTEIALQKEETLTSGGHSVTPILRQAINTDKTTFVWTPPFDKLNSRSELLLVAEPLATLPPETISLPHSTKCWLDDVSIPLRNVVTALEKESLLYATKPLTDCSGIFHRVLRGLKHQCPAKEFPTVEKNRDSRALARWYHERGKLRLIKNAVDNTNLLKPGAILFFGKNNSEYQNFSIEDLLTPQKGIAHLGVVVKVHKNKAGHVLHYELFHGHGRKGKTPASITDWHKRTPTRTGYPPFGNGRQQWVAMARL